jgi:hypothetical protein
MGRGRSVHKQPGAKVDGIAPRKRRDSKYVKGNGRGANKETSKGSKKGELRHSLILSIYVRVYNNCVNSTNKRTCLGYK